MSRELAVKSRKAPGSCTKCGAPRQKTAYLDEGGATRAGGVCANCGLVWNLRGFLPNFWTAEERTPDGYIKLSGMKGPADLDGYQIIDLEAVIVQWEKDHNPEVTCQPLRTCWFGLHTSTFYDGALFVSARRCNKCLKWLDPKGALVDFERSLWSQNLEREEVGRQLQARATELQLSLS